MSGIPGTEKILGSDNAVKGMIINVLHVQKTNARIFNMLYAAL